MTPIEKIKELFRTSIVQKPSVPFNWRKKNIAECVTSEEFMKAGLSRKHQSLSTDENADCTCDICMLR